MSFEEIPLRSRSIAQLAAAQALLPRESPSLEAAFLLFECLKTDLAHGGLTRGQRLLAWQLFEGCLNNKSLSRELFRRTEKEQAEAALQDVRKKLGLDSAPLLPQEVPFLPQEVPQPPQEVPPILCDFFPIAVTPRDRVAEASLFLGNWVGPGGYFCFDDPHVQLSALLGSADVYEGIPLLLTNIWQLYELAHGDQKARILCLASAHKMRAQLEQHGALFMERFLSRVQTF